MRTHVEKRSGGRRRLAAAAGLALALVRLGCSPEEQATESTPQPQPTGPSSFTQVTIGVADLAVARELWVDTFGLAVVAELQGGDPALERIWSLEPGAIAGQLLLSTPGVSVGRVHLVEFSDPDPPVRAAAKPTARCPKNVDLLCNDLPARYQELEAAGRRFRSEWVEYQAGELTVREVQMPSHDDINVVFLEFLGHEIPATPQGYAGLTTIVTVVPDPDAEEAFYRQVVGMPHFQSHEFRGEKIEKMVGLPPGAALDVRVLGATEQPLGRIEIVHYQGIEGDNLFPRARPPALGTLHPTFLVPSLEALRQRATAAGLSVRALGSVDTLFASGEGLELRTPAGMRVEAYETR